MCVCVMRRGGWAAGVLGDAVKVSRDKSKITVTTETAFSKRWAAAPSHPDRRGLPLSAALMQLGTLSPPAESDLLLSKSFGGWTAAPHWLWAL